MKFNSDQLQVINFYKGACAVIAGSGSGKSTVLVNRIKNLIEVHNVPQEEILAISFTNNTAQELKDKLNKLGYHKVNTGTFHAICRMILDREGLMFGKSLIPTYKVEDCFESKERKFDVDDIISFISYQKSYLKGVKDKFIEKESKYTEEELKGFYNKYEEYKKKNNYYDHDDTLIKCLDVLQNNKNKYTYDFVLIDEHQDSNKIQNLLIHELCPSQNVFCVFDYRQAIYSFRGGNPEYAMNFENEWDNPTIINLDINYRSPKNIVENANKFIKQYYGDYHYYSDSIAHSKDNGSITINTYNTESEEAEKVATHIEKLIESGEELNDIVVLFRLNSQVGNLEFELKSKGIDYHNAKGGNFFKIKEIAGIISYLRLIMNPHDDVAFDNVFNFRNHPLKFFSKSLYEDIKSHSGVHNQSLFESLQSPSIHYPKPYLRKNALEFCSIIEQLRVQHDKQIPVAKLIDNVIKAFKIEEYIHNTYTSEEKIEDRLKSVNVLKTFVKHNNLEQFISFTYSGSNQNKPKKNCVKLMSVHQSKGLEFKHVFLIGIEDEKFPHKRNIDVTEEARLFYVAVTRSKENLFISQLGEGNRFIDEYFVS